MKSNRLYTWTDVQNEIYMELSAGEWPDGLVQAKVFWDGLNIIAESDQEDNVIRWLEKIFKDRFQKEQDNALIILEQNKETPRHLEVFIETEDEEDAEEDADETYFRPLISKPTFIRPEYFRNDPPAIADDHPPIFAFHSFKGGVARTVHALALALLAASESHKVLLVDADLEAPGITWMLGQRKPGLDISFADILALIHGEPEDKIEQTLELIQDRVRNIYLENMFVIPAFRSSVQLAALEIRPEHLIRYSDNPYILTWMLGEIGKRLDADVVITDLRAGLSEISAGLLLDPRVHRIFVTTLSDQSLTGTCHEIEYIGKLAGLLKDYMPEPSVILSMIPQQTRRDREKMDNILSRIGEVFSSSFGYIKHDGSIKRDGVFKYGRIPIYESPFDQELLVLPKGWDEVVSLIRESKIMDEIHPLFLKNLGIKREIRPEKRISDDTETPKKIQREMIEQIDYLLNNQELSDNEFYITDPMKRLAADFPNKVPVAVIKAKKGAGKTSFFNYLSRIKSWKSIVREFSGISFDFDAEIRPIYIPLGEHAEKIPESRDPSFWKRIWDRFEKEGEKLWIDYFEWACGYDNEITENSGKLLERLGHDRKLVFVSDLPAEKNLSESLRTKFKELITVVPEWLENHHLRALGVIIFCDSDFLHYLFKEESLAPYLPYHLKMTDKDILEYVFSVLRHDPFFSVAASSEDLMDTPIGLKGSDDILTGYQLKSLFAAYRNKTGEEITPYTILIFLKTLLEILSDEDNKISTYDAGIRAMEKMVSARF